MHSGRVIIYPYVITLKSRCWNVCTQADWREKDCLKHKVPRKWRYGGKRQIGERHVKWRDEKGEKSQYKVKQFLKRWSNEQSDTMINQQTLMETGVEKFKKKLRTDFLNCVEMWQGEDDLCYFTYQKSINQNVLEALKTLKHCSTGIHWEHVLHKLYLFFFFLQLCDINLLVYTKNVVDISPWIISPFFF